MRQHFNAKLDTVNYKLRQVLQSATRLITNCDGTCAWYTSKFWSTFQTISISRYRPLTSLTSYTRKLIYKITKIVRALWLAERSVCMKVCKHGCGVKLFGFSCANHASTNLKKFSSSKLDKFTLFTHSFGGWNMENRCKECESIFLRLSWHFKQEKSVFCKASFLQNKNWLRDR